MKDNSYGAATLRGVILDGCILFERIMDKFISEYFADSEFKKNQLMEFILSTEKISFDSKRQIFISLTNHIFPDFKKQHPNFDKLLQELVSIRNILAHAELLRNDQEREEEDSFSYIRYKNGKRTVVNYNNEKIKMISSNMDYVGDTLAATYKSLINR
ncbi:hypothetical protein DBR43_09510 [Pedobacter sp. KBW06]|uniref:hypothetical protein n=1 Tax=Pedobacter sp. KBW06 TaxID=2153359 RepID=UPI000F5AE280|nr:hypothetical protein [Pedobacter sp. KBW06]RQO75565.1 hypothetical protein DBR43_09510 [Pedobacter sp. KBW06]